MNKIILLMFMFITLYAQPEFFIKGKKFMDKHPLSIEYLSQESGGQLTAEEAYSDGIGVMIVDSSSNFMIDYSPLNDLVKK